MKHLMESFDEELYTSALLDFYFKNLKLGVLDIETTGLNPASSKFILGGLLDCENGTLHQFFAENRREEAEALEAFVQAVSGLDLVVTYNGRHFDTPFIRRRLKAHLGREGENIPLPFDLDLYLVLNGHSPIRKFVPNLKQKTVENYMGLWQTRADEISGKESVELYDTYEKTGNSALEEKILLHNSDDVRQLARLLKVVAKSDFHKAMFHLGFPVGPLTVETLRIQGDFLTARGRQRTCRFDYVGFATGDDPVESRFESRDASFLIRFPLIRQSGLAILDLEAAGMDPLEFEKYPGCSSGFLVIESAGETKYPEINHFVKAFTERFINSI